jgi:hypothetical protein
MITQPRRRWGIGLVIGLLALVLVGSTPVGAQSVPVIVPPMPPIVVGIPPVFGGVTAHNQGGLNWSTTGRADVDVDINHQHGQAAAR